MGQWVGAQGQV